MTQLTDLTGRHIGRLAIVARAENRNGRVRWRCRCSCGREVTVMAGALLASRTKSCGCYNAEVRGSQNRTHGRKSTTEYTAWCNMRNRCYNPRNNQFHNYGGRGIQVCVRWRSSFEMFFADMGEKPTSSHSLDRINQGGNYEPRNCRWATAREQANNMRVNRLVTWDGRTQTVADWARERGLKHKTLWKRLFQQHMPVERALTDPMHPGRK